MERLRSGQYCSVECKEDARQQVDQLAVESLTLFGPRTRVVKEEKPAVAKAEEKAAEPVDPEWADVVEQASPGFHDAPVRTLGFPAWVAPAAVQRKKTIEDYRPVSHVPDEVMMEQELLLAASAIWVTYAGTNEEGADRYQSDFRFPLIVPAVGLPMWRRNLAVEDQQEIEGPAIRQAETAELVGGMEWMECTEPIHPRLEARPEPPDYTQIRRLEEVDQTPPAEAPPPKPTRPKVDAHRIATSFPAMMQAGLVRVEPGFATAVLELRAIAAPQPKRVQPAAAEGRMKPAIPPAATRLTVEMREAMPTALDTHARSSVWKLRAVAAESEQVALPAAIPPAAAGGVATRRTRPDIRVTLRYLPMPHFQLPGPASDWSH